MTAPTPEQVRAAADIVQALSVSMDMPHPDVHWRPSELRAEAGRIEDEIREAAECASQAAQLAELCRANEKVSDWKAFARRIIEAGWRRES